MAIWDPNAYRDLAIEPLHWVQVLDILKEKFRDATSAASAVSVQLTKAQLTLSFSLCKIATAGRVDSQGACPRGQVCWS